jgi:hypothetical protein
MDPVVKVTNPAGKVKAGLTASCDWAEAVVEKVRLCLVFFFGTVDVLLDDRLLEVLQSGISGLDSRLDGREVKIVEGVSSSSGVH